MINLTLIAPPSSRRKAMRFPPPFYRFVLSGPRRFDILDSDYLGSAPNRSLSKGAQRAKITATAVRCSVRQWACCRETQGGPKLDIRRWTDCGPSNTRHSAKAPAPSIKPYESLDREWEFGPEAPSLRPRGEETARQMAETEQCAANLETPNQYRRLYYFFAIAFARRSREQ